MLIIICNNITGFRAFLFLKYKIIRIGNQSIAPNKITRIIKKKLEHNL